MLAFIPAISAEDRCVLYLVQGKMKPQLQPPMLVQHSSSCIWLQWVSSRNVLNELQANSVFSCKAAIEPGQLLCIVPFWHSRSVWGRVARAADQSKAWSHAAECARGKWAALYEHSKSLANFITKLLIITKLLSLYLTTELSSWDKHSFKISVQKVPVVAAKCPNTSKAS